MGNSPSCVSGDGEQKSHKPLCNQDSIDFIVENTSASKEDVEEYQKNFLEQYPDGKIDKKGFSAMMKTGFPDEDIDKLENHMFRMYDINNDERLTLKNS